jgi:aspartyl-tRNA(Asn)/glutamyl-tRNA(Gln) amidotransferase subunit C
MKINVLHVAKLANLPLTKEDKEKFEKQLQETVNYVEELDKVVTKNVEPTSQVTGLENVLREDVVKPSLSQAEALRNAKTTHEGFFKVDAIFENDQ